MPFEHTDDFYIDPLGEIGKKPIYSFIKRIFDLVASGLAMIVLAIPMLIIAAAVKLDSPGTVLYRQERLGLNGKKFSIIKFRSMYMDAEAQGAQWSRGYSDKRITRVGATLRKTRLDELPQLLNIFAGQMSLVGPRPEREVFYNEFEKYIHGFKERLKVKPGLTGFAQVSGGYNLKPEEKIIYDIEYIKRRSVFFDLKIILKTVKVVFTHDGAK